METLRSGGRVSKKLEGLGFDHCLLELSILEENVLLRGEAGFLLVKGSQFYICRNYTLGVFSGASADERK